MPRLLTVPPRPKPVYKMISENIEEDRAKLASVTTIAGAGHYVGGLITSSEAIG